VRRKSSFVRDLGRPAATAIVALLLSATGEMGVVAAPPPAPPIVGSLGPLEGVVALDVSADGTRAAAAVPSKEKAGQSTLTLVVAPGGEPEVLELPGSVRALAFGADGVSLYAILHKDARRGLGEASLLRVDTDSLKTARGLTLPPTAFALDLWEDRDTLVVASANELRTFSLPALNSGPLYRVLGDNRAVRILSGGTQALVGQPDATVLVDLSDPQGRDGLPIRKRFEMPLAVAALAVSPDGHEAAARLADGRTYVIDLRSMDAAEAESRPYLVQLRAAPQPRTGPVLTPPVVLKAPEPPPEEEVLTPPAAEKKPAVSPPRQSERKPPPPEPVKPPPPPVEQAPAVPPSPTPSPVVEEPVVEEPPKTQPPAPPPVVDEPVKQEPPRPETAQEDEPAPVPAEPPPAPAGVQPEAPPPAIPPPTSQAPGVFGTLSGPAVSQVVAVVLMGPNSLVREAARVVPDAKGAWSVETLPPGRYRIVLDGGGQRVLVAEPPFRVVEVAPGARIVVPEFRVLRAL
jgi:hypothetical protein